MLRAIRQGRIVTTLVMGVAACSSGAVAPPVAEAGAITGKVVFEGKAPKMRPLPVEADPDCARIHRTGDGLFTEWLVLGDGQSVANVFVRVVEGLPAREWPLPETPPELSQKDCRYGPHVFVVRVGQEFRITNPDAILHNIHFLPEKNREYNKAMPKTKTETTHSFSEVEDPFRIKCDVHAWMEAFAVVMDHPFYDVTGDAGTYRIEGLEPGDYEIELWHERLGAQRVAVTVAGGEDAVADVTFTRPKPKQ